MYFLIKGAYMQYMLSKGMITDIFGRKFEKTAV